MGKLILIAALTLAAGSAFAQEEKIKLKDGPGKEAVERNCSVCHNLDYIPMNSPFLSRAGWDAAIKKMTGPFGATIDAADSQAILDYLATNYGG